MRSERASASSTRRASRYTPGTGVIAALRQGRNRRGYSAFPQTGLDARLEQIESLLEVPEVRGAAAAAELAGFCTESVAAISSRTGPSKSASRSLTSAWSSVGGRSRSSSDSAGATLTPVRLLTHCLAWA